MSLAPLLLALDTATAAASIALYDIAQSQLLAEMTWQARRRHTQDLLVTTQTLLAQIGLTPAQISALAVTVGPGSFTGVRIALSVVKGIGLGLPQPPQTVGLPTLVVTAAPWLTLAQASGAKVYAYIQAGRGRYNWASFTGDPRYRPAAADHVAGTATDFAAMLGADNQQPLWLVGEPTADLTGAVAALAHVTAHVTAVDAVSGLRRAGVLAQVAASYLAQGYADDLATLQPLYLQEP